MLLCISAQTLQDNIDYKIALKVKKKKLGMICWELSDLIIYSVQPCTADCDKLLCLTSKYKK